MARHTACCRHLTRLSCDSGREVEAFLNSSGGDGSLVRPLRTPSSRNYGAVIRVIHTAVKGRARYNIRGLYRSPTLKYYLESRLAHQRGIYNAWANTRTGNLLILFHPEERLASITAILTSLVAEYRPEGEVRRVPSATGTRPKTSSLPPGRKATRRLNGRQSVSPAPAQKSEAWHCMPADAVLRLLQTSPTAGLSDASAGERLSVYGPNRPPRAKPRSGLSILTEQFTSLPVALLGVAAGVSLFTGGRVDALVIGGVVVMNAVIGYVTESQSERSINSLIPLVSPSILVRRDRRLRTIPAEEVVPGDVPLRIDRVGAYAARYAAKNVVAAGLAQECEVQLSYSIGQAQPVSIQVETFGTGNVPDDTIRDLLAQHCEFRLAGIIKQFKLRTLPVQLEGGFYQRLAAYGHVGRMDIELPWEETDMVPILQEHSRCR